jgi:hypothetical protein
MLMDWINDVKEVAHLIFGGEHRIRTTLPIKIMSSHYLQTGNHKDKNDKKRKLLLLSNPSLAFLQAILGHLE